MSMKYLVIEGRAPQDGSTPKRALLLCPTWMSSTLVCAGIVGRIIELTDGNIVEERVLPYVGGEEELLEEIRGEFEASDFEGASTPYVEIPEPVEPANEAGETHIQTLERQNAELTAANKNLTAAVEGFAGWQPPTPADAPVKDDDSYRAGMQRARNQVVELLQEFGHKDEAPMKWLKEQLTQKAVEQRNLDAWRDAAGAAELSVEYDPDGMVQKIFTPQQSGGISHPEMVFEKLNNICTAYGCLPGQDRLSWLQTKLGALVETQGQLEALERDHNEEVGMLRSALHQIRKLAKKAQQ